MQALKIPERPVFDYSAFNPAELRSAYQSDDPFPHIVLDNFLEPSAIEAAMRDFDGMDWQVLRHVNENKSGNKYRTFPPNLDAVMREMNSPRFLAFLTELTGIDGLIADHEFGSGGVHRSTRGGFLNIHADFTVHPYRTDWRRRINLLIYLNPKWEEDWGGYLELWKTDMSECVRKIAPIFNRAVIFNTDYDSYHGHPEPMQCPEGLWRKSIALYYYTPATDQDRAVSTAYRARPQDKKAKALAMWLDNRALSVFHMLKRFGVDDRMITGIMGLLKSKQR